ncbi:hypothetical protein GQ457_04G032520 [Hibiscus cannabinus]
MLTLHCAKRQLTFKQRSAIACQFCGTTFLLGAMFGALVTGGFQRCRQHKETGGGNRRMPCPRREAAEKKPGEVNPGPEVEQLTP